MNNVTSGEKRRARIALKEAERFKVSDFLPEEVILRLKELQKEKI